MTRTHSTLGVSKSGFRQWSFLKDPSNDSNVQSGLKATDWNLQLLNVT